MSDSFRTKTGRCAIGDGHVRLETGIRGWVATLHDAVTCEAIPPWRRSVIVFTYAALLAGIALGARLLAPWLSGAAVGLVLAVVAWRRYERSRTPDRSVAIPLSNVETVEARDGISLLSRPRFVLRYRSEGGVKHRYLPCPSGLYGFGAYETGVALFATNGLLDGEEGTAARVREPSHQES